MIDCSIVIVNYNIKHQLLRFVDSIYKHCQGCRFEIVVVDNASPDKSAEAVRKKFPEVRVVASPVNLYVSKAFNEGLMYSQGRYVAFCDADLELKSNVFSSLVEFMDEHCMIGAIGVPFEWPDGTFCGEVYARQHGIMYSIFNFSFFCKMFPDQFMLLSNNHFYNGWDRKSSRCVEIVDTLLLARRETLEEVGKFDEGMKMYGVNNDLCQRIWEAGWCVYCKADERIIHAQHQSVNTANWEEISAIYRRDLICYLRKRHGAFLSFAVQALLFMTRLILRFAVSCGMYEPKTNIAFGTKERTKITPGKICEHSACVS